MNKRIRELAHEAGLPTYNPEGIPTKLEKFAELIVRECASIDFRHKIGLSSDDDFEISKVIKQHFGVEE